MIIRGADFISRLAVIIAVLFTFTACGGGGGGGGEFFDPPDNDIGLDISMQDAAGNETTTVTEGSPGTIRVFVRKGGANIVVSASTTKGTLLPASALTNSNSRAIFTLQVPPGTERGAGTVTATATTEDGTLTAVLTFEVGESGLRLGYFDEDGDFIENEIGITPDTMLAAQGRAQFSVAVLDSNGRLVDTAQQVAFTSGCLSSGLATLDPASPVTTVNGQVSTIYKAAGCSGLDNISASVVGGSAQAFGQVDVAPPEAAGVVFVAADPSAISIQGTGGFSQRPETSDVSFTVVDSSGAVVPGVPVTFSLSSTSSGASLSPTSATSASNGQVFTTVSSGDLPAMVRVIATIETDEGAMISNISDPISITSGLPVQSGISLSVAAGEGFVVENGMTQGGVARTLTVSMVDAFSQVVPNGTEARFEAEYGTIDTSCKTGQQNGARVEGDGVPGPGKCSVLWTSSNPRTPAGTANQAAVQTTLSSNSSYKCPSHNGSSGPCPDDLGYTRGGRSTLLVYGLGEESFQDPNNSGVMEPDESGNFENLPEAFLDKNEDNVYTPTLCESGGGTASQCLAGSEETYVDLNLNNMYDLNNNPAQYNGFSCPPSGDGVYCSRTPVNVRTDAVLILSAPDLGTGELWEVNLAAGSALVNQVQQGGSYKAYIADLYNNRPPAGSTITVTTTGGCSTSTATTTVGNSSDPGALTVDIQIGAAPVFPENDGTLNITINPVDGGSVTIPFACKSLCDLSDDDPDYCPNPAPVI
nr:hypothetical protein [uncultured Gammaproteobacteria bacterium]